MEPANAVMICLVGEQPVPNLLPIRHCRPVRVALIETSTTRRVGDNLERLLEPGFGVLRHTLPPYDIVAGENALNQFLVAAGWESSLLMFNLTGGTKPMSLAAFQVARERSSSTLYLQSEGGESVLYRYAFRAGKLILVQRDIIGESLSIDDYLRAHGLCDYKRREIREAFEEKVAKALESDGFEVVRGVAIGTLEIDLVIRRHNQVGIAEVKSGKAAERKDGIDQLSTASQREFLGTYTARFLIVDRKPGSQNRQLAEAHGITVIELANSHPDGLSADDAERLVGAVCNRLGEKFRSGAGALPL